MKHFTFKIAYANIIKTIKNNINLFMDLVNKYTEIPELTTEILNAFIDKVIVHEKNKLDDGYKQEI